MKKSLILFVLAIYAISNSMPTCSGIEYNPSTHFCGMDNKVYAKCGGSNEYNTSTHFCAADSKVYEKCNSGIYNPATHGCCNKNALYAPSTHFCAADNKVYAKCGGREYDVLMQKCVNNKIENICTTSNKCGSYDYDPAKQFCFNNIVYDKCGNSIYNPEKQFCSIIDKEIKDGGVFIDPRDDKKYNYTKIGSRVWMAQNLNYNTNGSRCYDDKPENCDKYGRLYNWATAMKACPKGWHLPSKEEWDLLTAAVGGRGTAGKYLKAVSGWDEFGNGIDAYGFSALPGGNGHLDGNFYNVGNSGNWWSAYEDSNGYAGYRYMHYDSGQSSGYFEKKSFLYSVRCLQG